MRKSIVLLICIINLQLYIVSAQHSSDYSSGARPMAVSTLPETEGKDDLQRRFFRQEWSNGTVFFAKNRYEANIPLLFDVYNNRLYFLKDKVIMEFIEPVTEFRIELNDKNDSLMMQFRNAYPPVHSNTAETFYEVLIDGGIQLLKCKAKSIYLHKDQEVPEERRRNDKEQYYVFLNDGEMVLIKKDKKQILQALPAYAGKIDEIINKQKLKLKQEDDLKELIFLLNRGEL